MDMPAGKERTGDCSMPMGVAREKDGMYVLTSVTFY
jgi:hypothetical protein